MFSRSKQTETSATGATVQVYLPAAAGVYLLGDFNNWSTTATPMTPIGGGLWEVRLPRWASLRHAGFFVFERGQRFGRILGHATEAGCETPAA